MYNRVRMNSRSDNHKPAQLNFEPQSGQVHCIVDIARMRVLFCMSDHHDVHCACPSPQ